MAFGRAAKGWRPFRQKFFHLLTAITSLRLEFAEPLGIDERAIVLQDEEVRNPQDLGIARQDLLVFVIGAVVDSDSNEVVVAKLEQAGVSPKKFIQQVAPSTPIPTYIKED